MLEAIMDGGALQFRTEAQTQGRLTGCAKILGRTRKR